MKWQKKGIIFDPKNKFDWAVHTALQPTPIILDDKTIRVYVGFRNEEGISRIGWIDLDINNPTRVLQYSQKPVLDIGLPGTFDDNGVVPTAIVRRGNELYLYYAGYQLVKNIRFLVFCGLAISNDNGSSFKRYKNTPVLERTDSEFLFRVIHSILFEDGVWKVWYGAGNHFIAGETKTLPVYDIRYIESQDGITFPENGRVAIQNRDNEHRLGRPYVVRNKNKYQMYFGSSKISEIYRLTYAESADGVNWDRKDEALGLEYNVGDFDSEMSAYPSVIDVNNKTYMFYNGNEYGKHGLGLAIRENKL
jgi:hypothetical protein